MLTVALLLALGHAPTAAPSLSQGRSYVRWLVEGETERAWRAASPELVKRLRTRVALARLGDSMRRFGREARVISEGLGEREGLTVYRRVMAVTNYARGAQFEITMDEQGRLAGVDVGLASGAAPTVTGAYRTKTTLRPPVQGAWNVLWGGRTWQENRHASVSDMRYALDLLIVKGGSSYAGRGERNEDYHAWRQPVLAPGSGTVVVAEDGVPDNKPNHPMPGNLYGNYIVIDHGSGEYSLLAHLAQGSVRVQVGEAVSAGQLLARTGSSGMSTEPHVHYHLMDHADWRKAQGLPAQFQQFSRNGQMVERAEPRRGDVIAPAAVEAQRERPEETGGERTRSPERRSASPGIVGVP